MLGNIKNYASLVKFSHTVFAMPFALISFFYAYTVAGEPVDIVVLIKILLCMVFARNAAMGFNRYADRKIDAVNPRTKMREIPVGKISARAAATFVIANSILFIITTYFINPLAFKLSFAALAIVLGYSLTKRFTFFAHIFLGLSLAIAPIGAYIAVTGHFSLIPLVLSGLVLTWSSGFDIIYSLQDAGFDRENNLNSMPAKFGIRWSLAISVILHLITVYAVIVLGFLYGAGITYWVGAGVFTLLLAYQHIIVSPRNLSRVNLAFGTVNGIASICYATFVIIDFYLK